MLSRKMTFIEKISFLILFQVFCCSAHSIVFGERDFFYSSLISLNIDGENCTGIIIDHGENNTLVETASHCFRKTDKKSKTLAWHKDHGDVVIKNIILTAGQKKAFIILNGTIGSPVKKIKDKDKEHIQSYHIFGYGYTEKDFKIKFKLTKPHLKKEPKNQTRKQLHRAKGAIKAKDNGTFVFIGEEKKITDEEKIELMIKSEFSSSACWGDSGGLVAAKENGEYFYVGMITSGFNSCGEKNPIYYNTYFIK